MSGSSSNRTAPNRAYHLAAFASFASIASATPPICAATARARAVIVSADPLFSTNRSRLAELALKNRLPSMTADQVYVEAGALVCYGPGYTVLYHHAASYADRILKGAKPGDLPIEQPTKFELVLNLKTAKAMGLVFPQSFLVRADRVIE